VEDKPKGSEQLPEGVHHEGDGFVVDTRPDFEVLIRGDLVDLRTRDVGVRDVGVLEHDRENVERPWLDCSVWLNVDSARILALQLQEACRLIEADPENAEP
jgi:hypothetical protein